MERHAPAARPWTTEQLVAASIVGWALFLALLVGVVWLCGCGPAYHKAGHNPVAEGSSGAAGPREPSEWELHCALPDLPEVPPAPPIRGAAEYPDINQRIFVHRRDYDAMVQWARDVQSWSMALSTCVENLREVAHLPYEEPK